MDSLTQQLLARLRDVHPDATYELDWETPEQMLVATILAAQCTDERVNKVTRTLFVTYPDAAAFAGADRRELEEALKPTGFFRQKARAVQGVCAALVARHDGKVPRDMAALVALPGVARKTANVVLNCCFDEPSGIIVDTHVARVSQRLGLTTQKKPDKIERDLMKRVDEDAWTFWGPAMVLHGRYTCKAKNPDCAQCPFLDLCPRKGVEGAKPVALHPIAQAGGVAVSAEGGEATAEGDAWLDPWIERLSDELDAPYFAQLQRFLERERDAHEVFPPADEVFSAFSLTPFDQVKVLILGQDPYHDDGQAHGLSFSVKPGVKVPPSLRNMYKELESDVRCATPDHGDLTPWARQGVLMLNAVLTVRAHKPNSHKGKGWEKFTDAVIRAVSDHKEHVVFVLWGNYAKKKAPLIDGRKHTILTSAHPSPLSARNGFFGSKPYSRINQHLRDAGQTEINWALS